MDEGIGPNVRYYRERIGMTQEQLGIKLGYKNHTAVVKIENGTLDPDTSTISRIATALGCGIPALFNPIPTDNEFDEYIPFLRAAEPWRIAAVRELLKMPEKKESSGSMLETS